MSFNGPSKNFLDNNYLPNDINIFILGAALLLAIISNLFRKDI